jgi:hypothetical protein
MEPTTQTTLETILYVPLHNGACYGQDNAHYSCYLHLICHFLFWSEAALSETIVPLTKDNNR